MGGPSSLSQSIISPSLSGRPSSDSRSSRWDFKVGAEFGDDVVLALPGQVLADGLQIAFEQVI